MKHSFAQILKTVSVVTDIHPDYILGRSRRAHISATRQTVVYLARQYTKLSYDSIAIKINRHRTSAMMADRVCIAGKNAALIAKAMEALGDKARGQAG